jgi:predicted aldo/keto reductase-like oxidoreductase
MSNDIFSNIKKLGFGLMRLPINDNRIDMNQTANMVDTFLQNGFTYFDTAPGYHGGISELVVKEVIVNRYSRESFILATKMPAWDSSIHSAEEAKQVFYNSLDRTGAGYFDYYLMHNMGEDRNHFFDDYNLWDFVQEQKNKYLIRYLGISFHDKANNLEVLLNEHPEIEFVQLQINYADWESKVVEARKCYDIACKYKKPIIVMEPIKGGSLIQLPLHISRIFEQNSKIQSLASWAIRYAASLNNVALVLSGMSSIEQVEENVSFMKSFTPLNKEENDTINTVQGELEKLEVIPCTSCKYCINECPQRVIINEILRALNLYYIYNNIEGAKGKYFFQTRDGGKASECCYCGLCEFVCPQKINIRELLKGATKLFES